MQLLNGPAFSHEPTREPIKQLRVSGSLPHPPKVTRSTNQPLAKMVLPDPVHNHSSGQRVLRAGNPTGKGQTAEVGSLGRGKDGLLLDQHCRHPGCDFLPKISGFSSNQHMSCGRNCFRLHHVVATRQIRGQISSLLNPVF